MFPKQKHQIISFITILFVLFLGFVFSVQSSNNLYYQIPYSSGCENINTVFLPYISKSRYFQGTTEQEPNNFRSKANGPIISGNAYTGVINDSNDYFSMEVGNEGTIFVELDDGFEGNHLSQYGVQLQLQYTGEQNGIPITTVTDSSAPYTISTGVGDIGWYYVRIYAATPSAQISYSLEVTYPYSNIQSGFTAVSPSRAAIEATCTPTSTPTQTVTTTPTASTTPTVTPTPTSPPTFTPTYTSTPGATPTSTYTPTPTTMASGWVEIVPGSASGGGISNNSGNSEHPAILYFDDILYLVWDDVRVGEDSKEIYIICWSVITWSVVDCGPSGIDGISNVSETVGYSSQYPSIAISTSSGTVVPYVAWTEFDSGDLEIFVRRLGSNGWVPVGNSYGNGGISMNAEDSEFPSIVIQPQPNPTPPIPYVVWQDLSDSDTPNEAEVYIKRKLNEDNNWVEVGNESASSGGISQDTFPSINPKIIFSGEDLYIVWESVRGANNNNIYFTYWDGDTWVSPVSVYDGVNPSVALAPDGDLYLAWQNNPDDDDNYEIFVAKFDGSDWEILDGNCSEPGVSGVSCNPENSEYPSISIASDGTPYVVWQNETSQGTGGDDEIYIKSWNEQAMEWEEVGVGSATNGGISNNESNSLCPKITIGPAEIYVSWENHGSNNEIYVLKYILPQVIN